MFGSVHFQRLGAAFSLAFVVFQVFDLFRPTELYTSKIGTEFLDKRREPEKNVPATTRGLESGVRQGRQVEGLKRNTYHCRPSLRVPATRLEWWCGYVVKKLV